MLNFLPETLNLIGSAGGSDAPGLMDIQISTVVYTIVTFLVFLWIMTKFAWKPIANMINKRAEKISQNIADSEKAKAEAEEHKKTYENKLQTVNEEIDQLWTKGRESAEIMKNQIEEKAKAEAEKILQNAEREIEFEVKKIQSELRTAILNNSVKIASELVKRSMTDADHEKLAEEIFESIDKM